MKKYETPSIEVISIEVVSQLLQSSGMGVYDEEGDGNTGQLAPGKKDWDDDDDYGW